MYGNVSSIVDKTRNIRILLTNHGLITEMDQCGPTEKSENSGYIREKVTKHGTVGDVPDNYFYLSIFEYCLRPREHFWKALRVWVMKKNKS